ncbi:unnamed protein product [Cylicocyclus nassatus]|uniref:Uncharacterized protein n=1 Tax=Cylicocyclus nassatus TaxID=53992 RepID=A0AA36DLK9_CYLNA|nr:unnamed protein product [Cylicocyclus nassatus]
MISRPLLLQIILFGVALTTTKAGGDLREQSNLDLFGSSLEDDAKELENIFKSDDSAEQRKSEAPQTEKVTNTPISFIKVTETSKTSQDSSTQVFITALNENSTQANSANTIRRDTSDTASTMPSTKHGAADEVTVTKSRPSTPAEKDELLSATTETSDSELSTSDILITATMDITQRESTVTPREYISGSIFATSSESTSTPAEQSSTMMEGVNATMVLPSASTGKAELLEVTTKASELTESTSQGDFTQPSEESTTNSTTASTTERRETEDAASKAFTFTKGTLSTTTPKEVTSAAITKRAFLENDDPITDASTAFLSTATTTVSPIAESTSTITSKPTVTSSIIPTILPSTETDYSHDTSTPSTSTTVPSSTTSTLQKYAEEVLSCHMWILQVVHRSIHEQKKYLHKQKAIYAADV